MNSDCIFCEIVSGRAPVHVVWEDKKHLAFLSIFPNTDGFTVVTTKKHYSSYVFDQNDKVISDLLLASKKVAKQIDVAFEDVGRTGLIVEGMQIDHLHFKLFPMHGTPEIRSKWKPLASQVNKFFERYEGYISSHNYKRADDEKLKKIAKKIRSAKS